MHKDAQASIFNPKQILQRQTRISS